MQDSVGAHDNTFTRILCSTMGGRQQGRCKHKDLTRLNVPPGLRNAIETGFDRYGYLVIESLGSTNNRCVALFNGSTCFELNSFMFVLLVVCRAFS